MLDLSTERSRVVGEFLRTAFCGGLLVAGLLPAAAGQPVEEAESPPSEHDHGHGAAHRMHHEGASEAHGGGMRHDFSDAEHWAEMFDDPARDEWQKPDHVVELMAIGPGQTVADLGAGTGYFLPWLDEAVGADGRVIGLDPEEGMVDWMRDRAERQGLDSVEVRQIPFDDPGLEAAEADRILVVDTWHHIGNRVDYVGKLCRALREGGELWVVDFTRGSPHGPPARHRLTAAEVAEEVREGGLEPEVIEEELPDQWVLVGRRPATCPGD